MAWICVAPPIGKKITRALAKEFSEMTPVPNERPRSQIRLKCYAKLVEQKAFRPVTWAQAFCKEDGKTYRVNGQHTSFMFADLEPAQTQYATIEKYECDTKRDVAELYAEIDSKKNSRSTTDVNRIIVATIPRLKALPSRTINVCIGGMSYFMWLDRSWDRSPKERAYLMYDRKNQDFILWVHQLVCDPNSGKRSAYLPEARFIIRQPIVSAMMATWSICPKASEEFWSLVRDGSDKNPKAMTNKLNRFLHSICVGVGSASKGYKEAVGSQCVYCTSIQAWNAWRNGDSVVLEYDLELPIPKAI